MRRSLFGGIPLAVALLALFLHGWAAAKRPTAKSTPKATALVCTFEPARRGTEPQVAVVAGPLAGKGWVRSERAGGLMQEGDRPSLYAMETGAIGALVVTGRAQWAHDGTSYGILYAVREDLPAGKRGAYDAAVQRRTTKDVWLRPPHLLAAWSASGRNLHWIRGDTVKPDDAAYRKLISNWLAERGVPPDVRTSVEVEQIVRADINSDGRDEVFLSFHTPPDTEHLNEGFMSHTWHARATERHFSYLVMRWVPVTGKRIETVAIDDNVNSGKRVHGFCDLDGDGWAEIVTSSDFWEGYQVDLRHWRRGGFAKIVGWGESV